MTVKVETSGGFAVSGQRMEEEGQRRASPFYAYGISRNLLARNFTYPHVFCGRLFSLAFLSPCAIKSLKRRVLERKMDVSEEIVTMVTPFVRFQISMIVRLVLGIFWCLLHLAVSIMHTGSNVIRMLQCYIISAGLLRKYQNLELHKLRYLAIVVDSDEAKDTRRIRQLLHWLSAIGVKHVSLYDMEGVMKKTIESDTSCYDGDAKASNFLLFDRRMTVEVLSFSDNKEAIAKAASFLCSKHLKSNSVHSDKIDPVFTEADMTDALTAVGCSGPDPDLLLVYGPARCHLGFPAWRMRYTEIVHMGQLKYMKYGAIVKAIYDYSKKNQNYGS